jgi:pescadillo protein
MVKLKRKRKSAYITRSQAIRKLEVTLNQFKYLCVINGIYPRVPGKSVKDKSKIYYHVRDIKYLKNGPVLSQLREAKIFNRKEKRAYRDSDLARVEAMQPYRPKFPISKIIKDRHDTSFLSYFTSGLLCSLPVSPDTLRLRTL